MADDPGAPPSLRPRLCGVLETVLYYRDQPRTEAFYGDVLGFRLLAREPGRSLFYRAGASVFLLFDARATRQGGTLPAHGASGSIHTCFRVPPEQYGDWMRYLVARGVPILHEAAWPRGGKSFYFEDPDRNLLEIADSDFWPA